MLKADLFRAYRGFADKRIKNLDKGDLFIIDDRGRGDLAADGHLFLWFCLIFLKVLTNQSVQVELRGGVPTSAAISAWAKSAGATAGTAPRSLTLQISKGSQYRLDELASLIADVVAPGKAYGTKAFKYVCPRTAASLRRASVILTKSWSQLPED